jgi:hypothetical protein
MSDERLYRLGPRERRGLIAGWRPGQVVSAGTGCALAGLTVSVSSSAIGVAVALALLCAGIICATIPLRGRSVEEWAPVIWWHMRHRGEQLVQRAEVVEVDPPTGAIRLDGRFVLVLELAARGITLLEPGERARLVEGLSSALGLLAREGSMVDRVSWSVRTTTDDGAALLRDLRLRGRGPVEDAVASYRLLLGSVGGRLPRRTVHLALRARVQRTETTEHLSGLLDGVEQVARALEDAGHPRGRALSAAELRVLYAERLGAEPDDRGCIEVHSVSSFADARIGGELVVSWWVAEWPRHEVTAELLSAVLLDHEDRTMSVVLEPVAPGVALRRAQVARTAGAADDEVRRRGGFLADRRREREARHLERREEELVDGHGSLRFAGYLSVAAPDAETLRSRVVATELAASQSGLVLRRCQGDHARGLLATLPLTGGLP